MAMQCPKCGHEESYVVDVRKCNGGLRRRRECDQCGTRYTTYELFSGGDTKKALIRDFIQILSRNIKAALEKSYQELKDK